MSGEQVWGQDQPGTIVLFGPTASGKSDLALRLAERYRGTIVNSDSMQLYRDLRVLTARPDPAAEARVPHRLYGVLEADQPGSAGDWLERVADELARIRASGRVPVVVGGTGLYIRALLDGIAPVPPIPAAVRDEVRGIARRSGPDGLIRRLRELDQHCRDESGVVAGDPQRLMRALEVVLATGRPLRAWHAEPPRRLALPEPVVRLALAPPRPELKFRIERRLRAMIEHGALDEVRALRERGVQPTQPVMKAVAVREFLAHLDGVIGLETACHRAAATTRRYAKRQFTWLRHRMGDFEIVPRFGDAATADSGRSAPVRGRAPRHGPPTGLDAIPERP